MRLGALRRISTRGGRNGERTACGAEFKGYRTQTRARRMKSRRQQSRLVSFFRARSGRRAVAAAAAIQERIRPCGESIV